MDRRFGLGRVLVVADRGLVSPDNLAFLSASKFRYLLGIPARRSHEGARVLQALAKHHGHRYYSYDVPGVGQFRYDEDPAKMQAETLHEGKYILKTDDETLGAPEAVGAYKELDTVESGFRDLKDVIEMRPVYHKTDDRIRAHLFVATLALLLERSLEHQLAAALPELSGTDAIAAMRSIGLAELDLHGRTIRLVSGGSRDARRVLRVLGITDVTPPRL